MHRFLSGKICRLPFPGVTRNMRHQMFVVPKAMNDG
jgi:hypothetical protein